MLEKHLQEVEEEQKQVKVRNQTYGNIVSSASIGICVMNAPSLISRIVNDQFVEIAGRAKSEIIDQFY